ncbi:hypothetical protein TVAG_128670 [Trichomonas vaginalis G3]|uniref:Thioredoxin domain-containing protein n=1 Tax=Trichomonas vaginalis (strain ATCC PRA-98 / G3) TaxID=412133 RepID=A2E4B8_TRIV3|nr:disulfide-isomerase A6 family [Trichomonas vaginalis G3]EAY12453.1 hypothetical protein TVAG_128670 [Trichomonas vaginalis G3]KAI5539513.1 disulfide-isomerase A6 family [Trichomonas vaginalis G3]|eukprot:XP_001324676.1 hypothetical protein [Trichomonas vaginalis G3]
MFSFLQLASAIQQSNKIEQLNYRMFKKMVLNRTSDQTWVVFFYDESNKQSNIDYQEFIKVAHSSLDAIHFGSVDVKKNVQLCEDLGVYPESIPKIMIYHHNGQTEYIGSKKSEKMSMKLLNYIPILTKSVSMNWKTPRGTNKYAILFGENETVPSFWNALAGMFIKSSIKIGYTCNETIFDHFDVMTVPSIVFVNSTDIYQYHGKANLKSLKQAISDFNARQYSPVKVETPENEFYFSDEFEKYCLGQRAYCVVHATEFLDQRLEKIRAKTESSRFNWFYGFDDWPYEFIKPKSLWLFNPRSKSALKLSSLDELEQILTKILNKELPEFKPISEFEKSNSEL